MPYARVRRARRAKKAAAAEAARLAENWLSPEEQWEQELKSPDWEKYFKERAEEAEAEAEKRLRETGAGTTDGNISWDNRARLREESQQEMTSPDWEYFKKMTQVSKGLRETASALENGDFNVEEQRKKWYKGLKVLCAIFNDEDPFSALDEDEEYDEDDDDDDSEEI